MNKLISLTALAIFLVFITTSQSNAQKETRDVDEFTEISFGISGNLYLKQGSQQSVVLEGDDLDEIETDVSGGKLRIRHSRNFRWDWGRERVDVYITITRLDAISLSGSGKVIGESTFKTDNLDLTVSGSGNLDLDIDADEVDSGISGSGDIELRGRAGSHDVSISGSGKLTADDLEIGYYKIHISGSGSCRIHATKEIDASVSGSGSIYYRGDPDKVYSQTSGSGKIRKVS